MSFLVTKVGEGLSRANADDTAPIDIKYSKLLDRLVRLHIDGDSSLELKKIPVDWKKRLAAIHANAVVAEKGLTPQVRNRVNPSGELPLDYVLVRSVRDCLSETAEKTLFGGLAGQAGIWDKLVTAYERQGVWMAEAGLQMQRSVDYELPFHKKSAAQLDQQLQALKRRHEDLKKGAQAATSHFQSTCAALGITGRNIAGEVSALGATLPGRVAPVIDMCQDARVESALEAYSQFAAHVHSAADAGAHVPTLEQLRGGGVTFTDADRDVPAEVPSTDTHAAAGLETSASAEPVIDLDWGSLILETEEGAQGETSDGGEGDAAGAPHIQTVADGDESSGSGDGVKVASDGPAIISWDCEQTPEAGTPLDTGAATPPDEATAREDVVDIEWDIDIVDTAGNAQDEERSTGEAEAGAATSTGGVDAEPAAMRIAYDSLFRGRLAAELHELSCFVSQRLAATASSAHDILQLPLPESALQATAEDLEAMKAALQAPLTLLASPDVRNLVMIASSRKYVERLVRDLEQQAGQESKLTESAKEVLSRQQDVQRELMGIAPTQAVWVGHLQRVATAVTDNLSQQLKRSVKLSGDINNWLS